MARLRTLVLLSLLSLPATAQRFTSERTTVWLDRSQVVGFRVAEVAVEDLRFDAESSDPGVVEVLRRPEVLAGRDLGWLRVRGRSVGTARIRVGEAVLDVEVQPVSAAARSNRLQARFATPVQGAVVWGELAVGVEVSPGIHDVTTETLEVRLRLPDGDLVAPSGTLSIEHGPVLRVRFDVDAGALPEGEVRLVAEVRAADGDAAESEPLTVRVVHPDPGDVFAGECEDFLLPDAEGNEPRTGGDGGASGGRFVVNTEPRPVWSVAVDVGEAGRYQMMIVARGDFGRGAFPSVGLGADRSEDALTTARLVDRRWQRIPLGFPVELEAGERALDVRFLNDEYIPGTADRNLFLDRFELLRVEGDDAEGPGAARMAGMMYADSSTMGGGGGGGGDGPDYGASIGAEDVWLAFERPLDGLPVNGRLTIQGACRWTGQGSEPAPVVTLEVDGEVVQSQQAAEPVFALDRSALREGPNEIRLTATLADGRSAATPVQTVYLTAPPGEAPPRGMHRFSVVDRRWADVGRYLTDRDQEPGHSFANLEMGASTELSLPDDLAGEFLLLLQAMGPEWPRGVEAGIHLKTGAELRRVGGARVFGWWNYHEAGTVTLAPGPKSLVVEQAGSGDDEQEAERGLWLRSLILREERPEPDRNPPQATILYPPPGHVAHGVDAVVVDAFDDVRLEQADVLIDGRRQRTFGHVPDGVGHVVLPLLLRSIAPGDHTLAVRLRDDSGNLGETAEVRFTVAAEPPAELGPYARAVRLLNRFAYGPEPQQLAQVLLAGERAWLEESLGEPGAGDAAALGAAVTHKQDVFRYHVARASIIHLLRTDNPARARFALWAENHFSTWVNKVGGPAEWYEHRAFLDLGAAPFGELLATSASSPAMLYYLDQQESYAGELNENYAREIMELHTLGVDGGYTQDEVTSLAGLLSGLTLAEEAGLDGRGGRLWWQFRYDPDLGDSRPRDILGLRFERTAPRDRHDRLRLALELLAAHPSTARFVGRKLAEHYVSVPAPDELVDDLARVFLETGGDMRAVLVAVAEHPAFREPDLAPRVTTPLDFALRLARVTNGWQVDWAVMGYLDRSGMALFDRATPDGYPEEDAAWIDTNGMTQRWSLAEQIGWLLGQLVPGPMHHPAAGDRDAWRQKVVDVAALRLTGSLLGEESNRAALDNMAAYEGNAWERVLDTAVLIARLPEASLK